MATANRVQHTAVVPTVPPPAKPSGSAAPLAVAEAAARVGLTAATLRTWDRRYALSPSVRSPGGHRRYDGADLARLRAVAALVDSGVPVAEAVTAVLAETEPAPDDRAAHGRPGGGRVLPLPGGTEAQRGLARAAGALDGPAVTRAVADLLQREGVERTWSQVLVPVLVAVGDRWGRTERGVDVEHVLSKGVGRALAAHGTPVPVAGRPVLLACVPEEQHSLPLVALQAALRERSVPSVLLGSRVPPPALIDAVRRLRPRRLVLWAQLLALADPSLLEDLPRQRPPLQVVLAGPGWEDVAVGGVSRPHNLEDAVSLLVAAA